MTRQITTLLLGLSTLAGVAQAQSAQQRPQPTATTDTSDNMVTVQNDRKVPVTVYMDHGEFDLRLGRVPGFQTATLPLPAWAVRMHARIRLFAHPEGELDDLATQHFSLQPPARLSMIIPTWDEMSRVAVDTMMEVIPPEELADATLTVDNPRSTAVTVFAEQGPFDVRLGQVPAQSRVTLKFPKSVVFPDQSIKIFVHPEGGFDLASERLQVGQGQHLGLRVPLR